MRVAVPAARQAQQASRREREREADELAPANTAVSSRLVCVGPGSRWRSLLQLPVGVSAAAASQWDNYGAGFGQDSGRVAKDMEDDGVWGSTASTPQGVSRRAWLSSLVSALPSAVDREGRAAKDELCAIRAGRASRRAADKGVAARLVRKKEPEAEGGCGHGTGDRGWRDGA